MNTTQQKNKLVAGIEQNQNVTTFTDNGALSNVSTLDKVLDFFASGGAQRSSNESQIIDLFSKSFFQNKLLTLKTLFYFRDIRGGQGERRMFRVSIKYLADFYPEVLRKNLSLIPEFGRWDDLFVLERETLNDMVNI